MHSLTAMAFNPSIKGKPVPKRSSLLAKRGFSNIKGSKKNSGKGSKKEVNVANDFDVNQ